MIRNKQMWIILAIVVVVLTLGVYQSVRMFKDGVQAYLFGYPLVLLDQTQRANIEPFSKTKIPFNHFAHAVSFPDHRFRGIVRPNIDTLYSVAWFDLSDGPVVLSVPDAAGRYYVMPFMDAWSNVFAMVGKRTTGTGAGDFMLFGPNWKGDILKGVKGIKAPTDMVWMIGRIQVNGENDLPGVYELQKQFKLTPLGKWSLRQPNRAFTISAEGLTEKDFEDLKALNNPSAMVDAMPVEEFFSRLSNLMAKQPAAKEDGPVLKNLGRFGIAPGKKFQLNHLNPVKKVILEKAVAATRMKLKEIAGAEYRAKRQTENGWLVIREGIGAYGTAYDHRAAIAVLALGALVPEEAVYPTAFVDNEGKPLNGRNRYRIHFEAGQTPPVYAFWSLTLYDENSFLTDNPIKRYAISDRDALQYNQDGSLDIFIQHKRPERGESNWLPACEGDFSVTMRLYMPKSSFFNGQWKIPSVERINR